MTRRLPPDRRAGFTMVELLIVIVIIALLTAMLLAGVSRAQKMGATVVANNDISQLTSACEQFKQEFKFYPPSTFAVPTRIDQPGFLILKRMYPRWNPALQADMVTIQAAAQPPLAGSTLDGNQSMVYFLGGPQQTGWAVDGPYVPTAAATTKKGPFFDFKEDRLDGTLGGARHFLDPFKNNPTVAPNGTPYAYFASVEGGKYPATTFTWGGVTVYPFADQVTNPTPPGGIVKYVNHGTVQIISAGEDGVFGPGCPLVGTVQCKYVAGQSGPAAGVSPYAEGDAGADDVGNFNNGNKLGVGR